MKSVAIVQSSYIPWKGFFDMIHAVDEFMLFDDVQYTTRDWRNRNKIKVPGGTTWLTIPVKNDSRQRICDTRVVGNAWVRKHREAIRHSYSKAPYFQEVWPLVKELYEACAAQEMLSGVNRVFIGGLCRMLGITTTLSTSMDYAPEAHDPTDRLVELCRKAGAARYLSGPAAKEYLDESRFREAGLEVVWMEYGKYPEYDQLHPPFVHEVSVIDTLCHLGLEAASRSVTIFPRLSERDPGRAR